MTANFKGIRFPFSRNVIFLCAIVFLSSYSCENEEENEKEVCSGYEDQRASLIAIDGETLPYTSLYIDDDNYSLVTGGSLTLFSDGTWESTLDNKQKVNGVITNKLIERQGTWECSFLEVILVNDLNQEAGTVEFDVSMDHLISISSTNRYLYEVR